MDCPPSSFKEASLLGEWEKLLCRTFYRLDALSDSMLPPCCCDRSGTL